MADMNSRTVQILPETQDNILCVSYSGIVNADDYERVLQPALKAALAASGTFRLLIHYAPGFKGWEPEAAAANFRNINDVNPTAERMAFVNPPERKVLQLSLQKFMWKGQVRLFDQAELDNALGWIKEEI
jgi:hypothetical protein